MLSLIAMSLPSIDDFGVSVRERAVSRRRCGHTRAYSPPDIRTVAAAASARSFCSTWTAVNALRCALALIAWRLWRTAVANSIGDGIRDQRAARELKQPHIECSTSRLSPWSRVMFRMSPLIRETPLPIAALNPDVQTVEDYIRRPEHRQIRAFYWGVSYGTWRPS